MSKKTLSVVLPIYNGEPYFPTAIQSILEQQEQPFDRVEIIAVNDGSSDASMARLQEFAQSVDMLKIIHLKQNLGIASARNAGVAVATGDWLAMIDQDDAWLPNKLALQYAYLQAHPECDFVLAHQEMFVAPGHGKPSWVKQEWLEAPQTGHVFGTMLIPRKTFLQVGLLNPERTEGVDDVEWFIKASEKGFNYHMLEQTLLHRQLHEANHSQRTYQANRALLELIRNKFQLMRERAPIFSVIMPAYNAEKTILHAIESALPQLGEHDELLVVDDGSSDNTLERVKSISDKRLKIIQMPHNQGISAARNMALKHANGTYISLLDSDDWWPNGRLDAVKKCIQIENPDLISGIVSHEYCQSLNETERQKYRLPPDQHASIPGSVVVRKACVDRVDSFDETLKTGEFIDWILRIKKTGVKSFKLDKVLLKRRIHAQNYTLLHRGDQQDYLKIVRQHLRQVQHES